LSPSSYPQYMVTVPDDIFLVERDLSPQLAGCQPTFCLNSVKPERNGGTARQPNAPPPQPPRLASAGSDPVSPASPCRGVADHQHRRLPHTGPQLRGPAAGPPCPMPLTHCLRLRHPTHNDFTVISVPRIRTHKYFHNGAAVFPFVPPNALPKCALSSFSISLLWFSIMEYM